MLAPDNAIDPDYAEGKRLVASEAFTLLVHDVKATLLRAWNAIESAVPTLLEMAGRAANLLTNARQNLDRLDTLGCENEATKQKLETEISEYRRICNGSVPQETYDWCVAEKPLLEGRLSEFEAIRLAYIADVDSHQSTFAAPFLALNAETLAKFQAWKTSLQDFNRRTREAIDAQAATQTCKNTVNVHVQRNGSHEYLPPTIANLQNATKMQAKFHVIAVADGFYALHSNNVAAVEGLGQAKASAIAFVLKWMSKKGSAIEKSFNFSPGPPTNIASTYRLDVVITGEYPCPERNSAMVGAPMAGW